MLRKRTWTQVRRNANPTIRPRVDHEQTEVKSTVTGI